jgi:fluoroacetyl-CoA thioesterase
MRSEVRSSQAEVCCTVSDAMTAQLDGKKIHPVYSTFWLALHAETAARRAIEPFFEDDENAVGGELHVRHLEMTAVGTEIRIVATVQTVTQRKIVCSIEGYAITPSGEVHIATGSQTQIVLPQAQIDHRIQQAYKRG